MIKVRLSILFRDNFETAKQCWQKIITKGKRISEYIYQYKGYEFHFRLIRPTYIYDGRNEAITDYSETGNTKPLPFDVFGFIDSDVKSENDADDIIKALKHDKDIVAGCYLGHRSKQYLTWGLDRCGRIKMGYGPGDLKGLCEVDATATGFMFIKRRVFEKIPGPWFFHPLSKHEWKPLPEDKNFCILAKKYNFKIYVDADIKLHHDHRTADQYDWNLTLNERLTMSEKKAKEARKRKTPEQIIKEKWLLKRRHEAEAGKLLTQITGIAEALSIEPEALNKIIGEEIFYLKGGETDGNEKENQQSGNRTDRKREGNPPHKP